MDFLYPESRNMGMIPFSQPLRQYLSHDEEIHNSINRVLNSGNYILGEEVDTFEKAFSEYVGARYAVGVNSGTDALILALKAFNVGAGDEVITVSFTALATVAAVIAVGATPLLVDVEEDTWTLDASLIEKAISEKTRAIIVVHLYGQPADMTEICKISKKYSLFLIEDCAQAVGTRYHERTVGTFGDAACFSFYPTKNLGAIGDGGMVVTNHPGIAEKVSGMRQYGWDLNRQVNEVGVNSRLDALQAAVLKVKLKYLDEDNSRRREIARLYLSGIKNSNFHMPKIRESSAHSFHLFVCLCDYRESVIRCLNKRDIGVGIHYHPPIHMTPKYMERVKIAKTGLAVTERAASQVISLPMFPELTSEEIEKVINAVNFCC